MLFLELIKGLLGFADPIAKITKAITDEKVALAQAANDAARVASQERIATLEKRRDVLIAEAGSRVNSWIRGGLALGPLVWLLKVFLFDKVLGSFLGHACGGDIFCTDPLGDDLWKVIVAVIGFYFLYDMTARLKR